VSPEHNRKFYRLRQVTTGNDLLGGDGNSLRCDLPVGKHRALTGRAIQWDPKQEKVINDPEAAKMLVRPYHEKWRVW